MCYTYEGTHDIQQTGDRGKKHRHRRLRLALLLLHKKATPDMLGRNLL